MTNLSWSFSVLNEPESGKYLSETIHDFLSERALLNAVGGHGSSNKPKYLAYIWFVMAIHFFLMVMAMITICIASTDKVMTIHACHTFLLVVFSALGIFNRLAANACLKKTTMLLKSGIYQYKNEEVNREHLEIKKRHVSYIRRTAKSFTTLVHLTALFNVLLLPIVQLMFAEVKKYGEGLNPYLHRPFYMPFNTWTPLGFIIGFFFNSCFYYYLSFTVACVNEAYMSCTLQLKAELDILNDSLRNIDRRAYLIYNKYVANAYLDSSFNDLFCLEAYQKCLYECLRSNIEHHQAILTFKNNFHRFTGGCVLANIAFASIIFGANLFIILEDEAVQQRIFSGAVLFAGLMFIFRCSYYGELVLQKSSELYFSLYETPWMSCNVRFNRLLGIMMCNTRTPIKISSNVLDLTASLETFGDIICGMYKFFNVARHDSVYSSDK